MNLTILRLTTLNNPSAWKRAAAIIAGIAIGTAMLLTLLGANTGLQARDTRSEWLNLPWEPRTLDSAGNPIPLTDQLAIALTHVELFRGQTITWLEVATTPNSTVTLPDGRPLPKVGDYLASPALRDLITAIPSDQLGARFGHLTGELPSSLLAGPDALVVVRGVEEAALRMNPRAVLVADLAGEPAFSPTGAYRTIRLVGAIALLIPVVLLVSIVTALGAVQRRERLQTLRLIGATPRDIVTITGLEMGLTAILGTLVGVGLAWLVRPLAAQIPVSGSRFYVADLAVTPSAAILVALTIAILAALVAAIRVNRDGIGPLGASRQLQETRPRAWRVAPGLVGVVALVIAGIKSPSIQVIFESIGLPWGILAMFLAIGGFALVCFGIIFFGSWLVYITGSRLTTQAPSAASLVAGSWFTRHPKAAFRSVSGLILALFVTSVFAGLASVVGPRYFITEERPGLLPPNAAIARLHQDSDQTTFLSQINALEGVKATVLGYAIDADVEVWDEDIIIDTKDAALLGFAEIPDSPCLAFNSFDYQNPRASSGASLTPISCEARTGPTAIIVFTDDTPGLERAQTAVAQSEAAESRLQTRVWEQDLETQAMLETMSNLAYLGVLIAIIIAGISLAVSAAASVLDNKRAFGLMRLMGMPQATLRQIITLQTILPLLVTIGFTIAIGFVIAWLLVRAFSNYSMSWPDPRYYLAIASATVIAAAAVIATFTTVRKATQSEVTRFE
ncbi:MAG: FtsX-like permease family protein [Propionibacteriaceae bacterium]|jgi:ABC-type lipoprotein release transport system permease subunit|nr:FtsX-like permease family protein [Propionibacteriaceae bacterium]